MPSIRTDPSVYFPNEPEGQHLKIHPQSRQHKRMNIFISYHKGRGLIQKAAFLPPKGPVYPIASVSFLSFSLGTLLQNISNL